MSSFLEVQIDGTTEFTFELNKNQQYIAGRKTDCDIVLEKHPGISRKHFKIYYSGKNWVVESFSEMRHPEYKGLEESRFDLLEDGVFTLPPYRFVFKTQDRPAHLHQQQNQDSIDSPKGFSDEVKSPTEEVSNISDSEEYGGLNDTAQNEFESPDFGQLESDTLVQSHPENDTLLSNDGEQTAIQSLSSLPYIKIFEFGGKKAEYFRLEGHMWVAGSDQQAPIFLASSQASSAHFEISKDKQSYSIIDLGTPIGTLVNGQRISATEYTTLQSGDLINVGNLTLRFELRDQSFQQKMAKIPLQMYESPLVFFGEAAGKINTAPEELKQAMAVELKKSPKTGAPKKNNRASLLMLAVVILGLGFFWEKNNREQKIQAKKPVKKLTPFDKLSSNEKKIVGESYAIARKFYLNRKYSRALKQYKKIHRVLSSGYKSSLGDEADCENFIELKKQRMAIEKEKRAQEALARRVDQNIKKCQRKYGKSTDLQSATLCLSIAQSTDPGNPGIEQLLSDIKTRIENKKVQEKRKQELSELTRQGKNLFFKAQSLYQANQYIEAMDAFEAHVASGLPDPENYVARSKSNLRQIQNFIDSQKNQLLNSARGIASIDMKQALLKARKAALVDPRDYEISLYVQKLEKDLSRTVRGLYMDSVLEERYGNLEASQKKWVEIIEKDVPDGDYYKKAARKLKQYGL